MPSGSAVPRISASAEPPPDPRMLPGWIPVRRKAMASSVSCMRTCGFPGGTRCATQPRQAPRWRGAPAWCDSPPIRGCRPSAVPRPASRAPRRWRSTAAVPSVSAGHRSGASTEPLTTPRVRRCWPRGLSSDCGPCCRRRRTTTPRVTMRRSSRVPRMIRTRPRPSANPRKPMRLLRGRSRPHFVSLSWSGAVPQRHEMRPPGANGEADAGVPGTRSVRVAPGRAGPGRAGENPRESGRRPVRLGHRVESNLCRDEDPAFGDEHAHGCICVHVRVWSSGAPSALGAIAPMTNLPQRSSR